MATFFVIALLTAIVGIIKPFIAGVSRKKFAAIAAVAFIAVGVTAPDIEQGQSVDQAASSLAASEEGGPAKSTAPKKPEGRWQYSEERDEMRGGAVTRYANIDAENTINLDFPYGEQRGKLLVRQSPKFGFDILVGVPSGQVLCHSYSNAHINAKFDDGPIERFGCVEASDGTSDMVFLERQKRFLSKLKNSKRLIVEAEFFQNGMQQMTFDVSNLKWE